MDMVTVKLFVSSFSQQVRVSIHPNTETHPKPLPPNGARTYPKTKRYAKPADEEINYFLRGSPTNEWRALLRPLNAVSYLFSEDRDNYAKVVILLT